MPTALLLGLWKIYNYEGYVDGAGGGSGITNWEAAAWRYWADGDASNSGPETLNAALYVTYTCATQAAPANANCKYTPLASR